MAYDESLAVRVRSYLSNSTGLTEMKMFGGLAFLVKGNMGIAVADSGMMVRVTPERYAETLVEPHVRPMEMAGRPMRGFVLVGTAGLGSDEDLGKWIDRGMGYAASLPPK